MGWKDRQRRTRAAADTDVAARRLRAAWLRLTPVQRAAFLADLAERRHARGVNQPPAWEPMPASEPETAPPRHTSIYAQTVAAFGADPHAQALAGPTALLPIVGDR